MSFLKVSTIRIGEAARKRKIKGGDILLAVDGYMFTQDTKELSKKFNDERQAPWLLSFKRGEVVFDVLFDVMGSCFNYIIATVKHLQGVHRK